MGVDGPTESPTKGVDEEMFCHPLNQNPAARKEDLTTYPAALEAEFLFILDRWQDSAGMAEVRDRLSSGSRIGIASIAVSERSRHALVKPPPSGYT